MSEQPAPTETVSGAQSLIRSLEAAGAENVFGIPGGAILPAYDPLFDSVKLRHILVRHEQGAGHAAQGYAAATGKVGVCMATSGPGATNVVTPIQDAMMDSVPTVFITGQVRTDLLGTDGFQEADVLGITMPAVKHSFMIQHPLEIPRALHEAFYLARSGRPGPVLVDLPLDVQKGTCHYDPALDAPFPVEVPQPRPQPHVTFNYNGGRSHGQPSAATMPLIEAMSDADIEVRRSAVHALGELEDPRAVEALMLALRKDSDTQVRETAAWALARIAERAAAA